jgi:hypothetical protein
MKKFLFASIAALGLFSCSKSDTPEFLPGETGELDIEFDNIVGAKNLQLNTGTYTNAAGESYTISMLNYYVSNIVLENENGITYSTPKDSSYFLIKEENPTQIITLKNIPAGNYKSIQFILGVDSVKCASPLDQRTGVLDPAAGGAGMYWTWNSGYIFLKMEGSSNAVTAADKKYRYHIGGFGGYSSSTINNIKKISLNAPMGQLAKVRQNKTEAPHIHILADAAKVFSGKTNVSLAANGTVMFSPYSVFVSENYAQMFSIDHIHND